MDHRDLEQGESSTSHAAQRHQGSEYRRRLLRSSSRPTATAQESRPRDGPTSTAATEDSGRGLNRRLRVTPDARWVFRAPEEPESGRWSLRGAGANTAGDDEEADEEAEEEFEEEADEDVDEDLDNADMNGDPAADADAETEIYEEEVDPEASVVGDAEEAEADEEDDEDEPSFDPTVVGLKEISNLASFTVSSYKPGCGVKELRDDDVNQYWQSDGPQPHRLNIHFIKRVEIRALRLFLDYELDESYTPTKIQITAGTGPNLTIPFTTMELVMPKGWIDVPIAGAGGGADGNSLCCFFVRVIILENHQNGKDTHIRGVKVYALDEGADTADNNPIEDVVSDLEDYQLQVKRMSLADTDDDALMHFEAQTLIKKQNTKKRYTPGDGGLTIPDFMREPEIR